MLSESLIAATLSSTKPNSQLPSSLKEVGICLHELQPQVALRHGFKKSSVNRNCLAISENHIFAAQADKAVVNVYSREKGNQEATVPFPERVQSLAYVEGSGILVIGTEGGKLLLWELATGRLTTSTASHLQPVTSLCITESLSLILSASADSAVHVWSLPSLISFTPSSKSYTNSTPRAPIRTFLGHRGPVTALACGRSKSQTAFAVSCSQDLTCYIWSIQDCQILRTYLLPSISLCLSVDIADRAIFVGYDDGSLQSINLYTSNQQSANQNTSSIFSFNNDAAFQMTPKEAWQLSATESDPTNCTALSYDCTLLLSGHSSGKIVSWDVAKGRVKTVLINLGQPVTNIQMLKPDGLPIQKPNFEIKTITKPRLDLTTYTGDGTSGIPPHYSLQVQITPSDRIPRTANEKRFQEILTCSFFPEDMLDAAIADLKAGPTGTSSNSEPPSEKTLLKIDRLEKEVTELNFKLDVLRDAVGKSRERRIARMERREALGEKKREAYFVAGKGKKGDAAMVEWDGKLKDLDQESDEEELRQEAYGDMGGL